jgi:hypothetical protein
MRSWKLLVLVIALGGVGIFGWFFWRAPSGSDLSSDRFSQRPPEAPSAGQPSRPSARRVRAGRTSAPVPRLRPPTPETEYHRRYRTELLPEVAAVLKLPPATTAALMELDQRLAVEEDSLRPTDPAMELDSVAREFGELLAAYQRAKLRVLGGVDAANRFEAALRAARHGPLRVSPPPPPTSDPDDKFTVVDVREYEHSIAADDTNKYDAAFASVKATAR